MTLTLPAYATTELVAITWLKANAAAVGLDPQKIAATLPRDTDEWSATGFVQLHALPGGQYAAAGTKRMGVVTVDCWWSATSGATSSSKPQWAKANQLIERVIAATEDPTTGYSSLLDLGPNYTPAVVLSVYPMGEPQRVENDPASYARYTVDLVVDWARVRPAPAGATTDPSPLTESEGTAP